MLARLYIAYDLFISEMSLYYRFKIKIEVVHDGCIGKFVFWDGEAPELFKTSAADLCTTMIDVMKFLIMSFAIQSMYNQ